MATSVIEVKYPNTPVEYGFLGLAKRAPKAEVETLADANLFTNPRKIYDWGYSQHFANLPFTAGCIIIIPHIWGMIQIAFRYNSTDVAMRGLFDNAWSAWKNVSLN